jgi:histidinol-phosphate aminotransferase
MSVPLARAVEAVPPYDARDLSDDGITVRLHRNESAVPPPEFVLDALRAIGGETLRTYPTALQRSVIELIAARTQREPAAVAIANGADELLAACARAVLDRGDRALTLAPTFGMYARVIALAGGTFRRIPYTQRWRIDVAQLLSAADERTKLVILGNPNNPTGDSLRASDLAAIAGALPKALILVDEVYLSLSERSLVDADAARLENVAILGSFSKSVAMAGARLGFVTAAPPLAAALRRTLGPYPVSSLTLVAANAYLGDPARSRAFETTLAVQNARSLDAFQAALAPFAREIWRGSANFLLADCGDAATGLRDQLLERGIAVRTFDDPMLAGMIRMCAGDDAATEAVVAALRDIRTKAAACA